MEQKQQFPDLSNLDIQASGNDPKECVLEHPSTGDPLVNEDGTQWTLSMISADSNEYRKEHRRIINKRIREAGRVGKLKATAEQLEGDALDLLVMCTKGWKGIIENGKPAEFSQGAARDLYTRYTWLRDQASNFINDRNNFLGN